MRNQKSLSFAKKLRSQPTEAEGRLWYHLRAKRFAEAKFRRQTVIGPFIADFTCRAAMLVIELDGDAHGNTVEADAARTAFLEAQGWRVLRFSNNDVISNIEGVLSAIVRFLPLSPTLSPEGERE
ncbi:endonuclease domain-containing protein [Sphingobium limneticum]|uniref:Endonuclease domain-containing protein n=1 Tax=Sphingobium limneticum TaxID=1007511 RepID=A0A5J5I477_9SPHN|nr:endonuclease domain-containing protein [Sphingobium limneticum]KAA9029892.1 endonuclease domain-containing protein [Sphingobium limneticum]